MHARYIDIHTHDIRHISEEVCRIFSCRPSLQAPEERFHSIGLHPWYIEDYSASSISLLEQHIQAHPKGLCAIGECGLDKLCSTPLELQTEGFITQIRLSEQHQYPLILHVVKAWQEVLELRQRFKPQMPWIIHGFRGKPTLAQQLLRAGLILSFSRYYNVESLRLAHIHDALLLESDDQRDLDIPSVYLQVSHDLGIGLEELVLSIRRRSETYLPHLYT